MIKKIFVDNFKALNGFDMDFEPFTVVVGNNMSGKSTILQVLDFVANTTKDDFRVILEKRGWKVSDVKSQLQKSSRMTIRCELEIPEKGGKNTVEWELQIQFNVSKDTMELFSEKVRLRGETEAEDKILLSYGQGEDERFVCENEKRESLPRFQTGASVLKMMDFRDYPTLSAMKLFFMNSDSFELLSPEKMRSSSRGDVNTIGSAGEKLPSFIKSMNETQRGQFLERIREIMGDRISNVEARTKGKPGWTQLVTEERFSEKKLQIESKNMSDGMLRLLAFLAICEIEKGPMLMLLDEIENGINIDYAEKIIRALQENCREKDCQMIVTTHSPVFLDYVQKEQIRYLYRDPLSGNCRSCCLSKTEKLKEKMDYLYPGELFMNMSNPSIIQMLLQEGTEK